MTRPDCRLILFAVLPIVWLVPACGGASPTSESASYALPIDAVPVGDAPGAEPPAGAEADVTRAGRVDFLGTRDARHAFVLDSGFDPSHTGLPPLDPPWVVGKNQLTILRVESGILDIEAAVPLGDENVAYTFQLSPDGDTALVGAWDWELGPRLLVVRGLGDGTGHVSQNLPAPSDPVTFAFSPDGRKALVGLISYPGTNLEVSLFAGLPDDVRYEGTIDMGVPVEFQANVDSFDVAPDGSVAVSKNIFCKDRSHQPGRSRVAIQVISNPFDLSTVHVSQPLWPSAISVFPPPPPYEGLETGYAMGDVMLLGDGETAVLPCTGFVGTEVLFPLADARILLIQGIRSGEPRIVRTLGPEDGVAPFPLQLAVVPGRDQVVVSNFGSESVTVVRGLGDPSLADVRLETHPMGHIAWEPAVTPDGSTLLLSTCQAPVDGGAPAQVTSHPFEDGWAGPAFDSQWEDVHTTYIWMDSNMQTWPPGLLDDLRAMARDGPFETGASLIARVEEVVRAADEGQDLLARYHLWRLEGGIVDLVTGGELTFAEASVLRSHVRVAQERLSDDADDDRVRDLPMLHLLYR